MNNLLANRYAKALYDLCEERGVTDSTYHDLKKIAELIRDSEDFLKFLRNPVILSAKKQEILQTMFEDKVSPLSYNFILFLESKGRLDLLCSIYAAFDELYRKAHEILRVKIISSVPLTKSQVDSVCHHLKNKFQKEIESQCLVDSREVGGFKIQIGDRVYDYSLRAQLETFKEKLIFA